MRSSLIKYCAFLRENSHLFVIALICIALWMLNARSSQLNASNEQLNESVHILHQHNVNLDARNDSLANKLNILTSKFVELNKLLAGETKRREVAELKMSKLQREYEFLKKGCAHDVAAK